MFIAIVLQSINYYFSTILSFQVIRCDGVCITVPILCKIGEKCKPLPNCVKNPCPVSISKLCTGFIISYLY